MVFAAGDFGDAGFVSVPSETHAISLDEAMKGSSPAARPLVETAYRTGFRSMFATQSGSAGAGGSVQVWSSAAALDRILPLETRDTPRYSTPPVRHVPSPTHVPGRGFALFVGKWDAGAGPVPFYLGMWSHGNISAGILVWSKHASPTSAVALARALDEKITHATSSVPAD
jgi:hypothetical protein